MRGSFGSSACETAGTWRRAGTSVRECREIFRCRPDRRRSVRASDRRTWSRSRRRACTASVPDERADSGVWGRSAPLSWWSHALEIDADVGFDRLAEGGDVHVLLGLAVGVLGEELQGELVLLRGHVQQVTDSLNVHEGFCLGTEVVISPGPPTALVAWKEAPFVVMAVCFRLTG